MIGNHAPFSSKKERTPIFSIHLIFTGVNALIHAYYEAVVVWHGTCPICDRPLTKNGRYIRKTPREIGPFWVHLVSCPTRKHGSHALIPCFVLPYQQVLAEQQELALVAMAERTHTVEQIAEELNVDTKTVYHWWSTFGRNTGIILDYLARLLAQLSELATWARRVGSDTRSKVLKALGLLDRVRSNIHPEFGYCNLSLLAVLNPYLLLDRSHPYDPSMVSGP